MNLDSVALSEIPRNASDPLLPDSLGSVRQKHPTRVLRTQRASSPRPTPVSVSVRQDLTLDENALDVVHQLGQATSAVIVEEFFEATVEEMRDEEVRLRTVSSRGEEGNAWLPVARVPKSEQPYLEIGAPVRITILAATPSQPQIRVLRPDQWKVEPKLVSTVAQNLLERMERTLASRG